MDNPFLDWFGDRSSRGLADLIAPSRTFEDVILPERTRRALDQALVQIEKQDLLYHRWGLAERHREGLGLAFNFAGPPGTGKTICAEAVANRLGKKLLVVRHADMQSMWVGRTGKNVVSVFEAAAKQDAVLFFDEADSIAASRFDQTTHGYEREANATVNILLSELEHFSGVVIFATNLATSFDSAFERRIRTHVIFDMPDARLRERIWKVQLHERKTPLADDVDFRELATRFEVSGGDIKNAVLKAAQAAIAEPGRDAAKRIHQRHFLKAMEDVLESKAYLQKDSQAVNIQSLEPFLEKWEASQDEIGESVQLLSQRQSALEDALQNLHDHLQRTRRQTTDAARERRGVMALSLLALGLATAALAIGLLL